MSDSKFRIPASGGELLCVEGFPLVDGVPACVMMWKGIDENGLDVEFPAFILSGTGAGRELRAGRDGYAKVSMDVDWYDVADEKPVFTSSKQSFRRMTLKEWGLHRWRFGSKY